MIVSITGGTGFVGSLLVQKHIEMGDNVRVFSRKFPPNYRPSKNLQSISGDLSNTATDFSEFLEGAEILYNCAGELQDENRMHSVHVNGTKNLLYAADGKIKRWVQLSSVGAYGQRNRGIIDEETPLNPHGVYEQTKVQSDFLVRDISAMKGFSFSILRPSNIFGGAMRNQSLFKMIDLLNHGLFFFVGKPGAIANYIHVGNVVDALYQCAIQPKAAGKTFILSDNLSFEEFVGLISDYLKVDRPKFRIPEKPVRFLARFFEKIPGFPLKQSRIFALTNRAVYSPDLIRTFLGFEFAISMERGIYELVKHWKEKQ